MKLGIERVAETSQGLSNLLIGPLCSCARVGLYEGRDGVEELEVFGGVENLRLKVKIQLEELINTKFEDICPGKFR